MQNGAGHDVNYKYGFGSIDATAAVNAARDWETVAEEISFAYEQTDLNLEISDNEPVGISRSVNVEEDIDVEWVEVVFEADHSRSSELEITLISPDGTESILAEQHSGFGNKYLEGWVFTSARHWGESSEGEWTLRVSDREESSFLANDGWNSWQLNFYGTANENTEPIDNNPTLANPIEDITVTEDAPNQTVDLTNVFEDVDGDEIAIAIRDNSNSELVSTTIEDNTLNLDFIENQSGTAEITLRATTNSKTVDDTFTVTVEPVEDAPVIANPITDITTTVNSEDLTIDLSNVFQDADGDEIRILVFGNTNRSLVFGSIRDNTLTLDFAENQSGTAEITLRATANGQIVEDTFSVTVNEDTGEPDDNPPTVVTAINDLTVTENDEPQTINLSDVFEDADGDEITIAVGDNTNQELVTTSIEDNTLNLNFTENQSGTAEITLRATANGQTVEETFSVTVEPQEDTPPQTIDLFRFRNITFDTGTYVFVSEEEKNDILADENLSSTFSLDGVEADGTVNAAFTASQTPGDNLIPFFRLKSLGVPGTFLFVSMGEYDAIFDADSDQKDKWEQEGFDADGKDIPEFYLYDGSADRGTQFNRFQNNQNETFLYAGEAETDAIEDDPNLSNLFTNQGVAFKSLS